MGVGRESLDGPIAIQPPAPAIVKPTAVTPETPALETTAGVSAKGSTKVMTPASLAVPYSIWVLSMIGIGYTFVTDRRRSRRY